MSLGWLTESTLIPQKPVPLKVGNRAMAGLLAVTGRLEQEHKIRSGMPGEVCRIKKSRPLEDPGNAGLEKRRKKDDEAREGGTLRASAAKLEEKAKLYQQYQDGGVTPHKRKSPFAPLVDFRKKAGMADVDDESSDEETRPRAAIPPPEAFGGVPAPQPESTPGVCIPPPGVFPGLKEPVTKRESQIQFKREEPKVEVKGERSWDQGPSRRDVLRTRLELLRERKKAGLSGAPISGI
eukprot:CAMPEP_0204354930 /NCGR_PEP_ID=MMETSP0469-20131031/33768_1 /ASSEMBLY_ACC=CAM_ASM_000384 /TAXON_ID=2969 /ORGANISM="Oxyrrhis marina" /LENGTH=236 /DNA_ID=CAMNT_0051342103 /DNA_START=1 /DNA_END=711 /DNA_ORIENTATION=+